MRVSLQDGKCRNCKGQWEIIEADDATMTVTCLNCGDSSVVEIDAFGDGGMDYWPAFVAEQGDAT
ncbi:MAG: hypothetical protein WD894_15100 [Pirellulales bacterium]